jgi:type VI secretion system secreted protein VgrG
MVNPKKDSRSVQLDGPALIKTLKLASLTGHEQISRPFEYVLTLFGGEAGADGALDADKILGEAVTVTLHTGSGAQRYFNGICTEFAHVGFSERFHEYRAVLRPAFWLLSRRADCRIFQKKSTTDIYADVCQQAGSIDHRLSLSGTYEPWEYRVQYRESDFDFLSRLLEHDGIYYYFEHSNGKHTMVLTDDVGKLTSVSGYDEVPYYPPSTNAGQRERDHLSEWAVYRSFQAAAFASLEYNFETPAAAARAASPVAKRKDSGKYEIFDYPAGAREFNAGSVEKLAKVRAEQLHAAQSVARSQGDAAGLGAGRIFKLKGHPRKDFNKKYLILSTTIAISSDEAKTQGAGAGASSSSSAAGGGSQHLEAQFAIAIEAAEADAPYRPERLTQKPMIQGSQTAKVVGASGKEIWTDKYGRVKVQFHWDRHGKSDDSSSCWVRVASNWAGKNWGAQQVPRVGQEVVVSFLDGDPDRPLIIGSVYNAEQMVPYDLPTNATQSGVKSRTSTDGTADNFNELRFEDKKGSEEIYLHAEKNMQVVIENNQTISVGATKKDKGDRTTTIQNDDKLSVGNDLTVTVTGKETRTITKARSTTAKDDDTLDVTKKLTLKAGDQITLECGVAKITLKSDGTVEISGKEVKVSGTMKASVDATQTAISGTQLDLKGTKTAVQGSGTLDLASSGIASLKGSLTKIG